MKQDIFLKHQLIVYSKYTRTLFTMTPVANAFKTTCYRQMEIQRGSSRSQQKINQRIWQHIVEEWM